MLQLIQKRNFWYTISGLLFGLSVVSLSMWGLKFGIDFTGGSLLQIEFANTRPDVSVIQSTFKLVDVGTVNVQPVGDKGVILRFKDVDTATYQKITDELGKTTGGAVTEKRFELVGPIIGSELKSRSLWMVLVAMFFIVTYIAWAFRKVSKPVVSWKYGVVAVLALIHDVGIVVGVFSVLGHFMGVEIDALFVSAILTVLGFSVHDTIVVFDRTRENLFRGVVGTFEDTVNKSVNDTLTRSINTSLTTLLALSALFWFGGETIRYFTLTLIIGITVGTYSSIFVASPLLVDWYRWGLVKK